MFKLNYLQFYRTRRQLLLAGLALPALAEQQGKVLLFKGAKAGDLPIEQPMKFELAVNLKTAKSLGLTMPPAIMVRADRVIE